VGEENERVDIFELVAAHGIRRLDEFHFHTRGRPERREVEIGIGQRTVGFLEITG
jgi:hypothetical protein